jgi:septal ring factor EnvC (AmiA/AmiB activator)
MNMGVFEFVLGIILIVTVGSIVKARYGVHTDKDGNEYHRDSNAGAENDRLRSEIGSLKERIQVLERVITDSESSSTRLDREIEQLRDKNNV